MYATTSIAVWLLMIGVVGSLACRGKWRLAITAGASFTASWAVGFICHLAN